MKQTAINWLKKILDGQKDKPFNYDEWVVAFDYAKEIEKEQMESQQIIEHHKTCLELELEKFRTQYPQVTSGDLQTFVIGWKTAIDTFCITDKNSTK